MIYDVPSGWNIRHHTSDIQLQACRPKVVATAVNTVITIFKILLHIELWFSLFIVSLGFSFYFLFCFTTEDTESHRVFLFLSFRTKRKISWTFHVYASEILPPFGRLDDKREGEDGELKRTPWNSVYSVVNKIRGE